jgi:flavin-dependent dehydrogenase
VPARDRIDAITFTRNGRLAFTRHGGSRPILTMVRRDDFDHAWYQAVVALGATVRQNTHVRAISQNDSTATVTLSDSTEINARVVIGADGSAGITSRYVGVTFQQQDLGLEVELAATEQDRAAWRGRVLLDWGPYPGSYGWVFPKMKTCEVHSADCRSGECLTGDDGLTVGVIMAKGHGAETKQYLTDLVDRLGLADREVVRDSGHLTRCRQPESPLVKGRVMVVGDAAGLLEPWTREGISYALRSGTWAGAVAAASGDELAAYGKKIEQELKPEMTAGRRLLGVYVRHPNLVHASMATPLGWRAFQAFSRGELSMARVLRRRGIGGAARLLGKW